MPAKKSSSGNGQALVIVESPAKARTISKFLGKDYVVEASIGHIRDLPQKRSEMPEDLRKLPWARLGVNVDDGFQPFYIVPDEKKKQVNKLKQALKSADQLFLATDEDREGEAISWHLLETLQPKVPVHRLVFHEITKTAIQAALEQPRQIDQGLVRAQETRRILDRLYGFEMSEFLWKKSLGRSAGRVQSVAVRLIVDRERERMAFVTASWWDILGHFQTDRSEALSAELVSVDGQRIPSGKDFDSSTGSLKPGNYLLLNQQQTGELVEKLKQAEFKVTNVEIKPYQRSPAAPFTTSTLQQEANRKMGFTAKRTMSAAQSLYENGFITYMRTDSTNMASEAVQAARDLVKSEYGADFLPDAPRTYASKVKNAQEAHEAIRPAGTPFQLPRELKSRLRDDEFRLFELIWKRTIASQMSNARGNSIMITIEGGGAEFHVSGKTIDFAGFLRAYVEGSDDPESELSDQEKILPDVKAGQPLKVRDLEPKSHTTQPPARYSEASLTRELEKRGIGRPSTYASIIETVQSRQYVSKKGNALVPSWTAFSVTRLMEEHFPTLVDYEFTAQMEDSMDAISREEAVSTDYLKQFYFGNGAPGLKPQLEKKIATVDAREICTFPIGNGPDDQPVNVRVGKYGPYIEHGERKATIPAGLAPEDMNLQVAIELLDQAAIGEEPLGQCPDTGRDVFLKTGRFGPYVQLAASEEDDKPKNSSLLKGMQPEDISLDVALQLLTLPRDLGPFPDTGDKIEAFNGKFGPYVKCGSETRSLPADLSVLEITSQQAIELLRQPKTRGRGRAAPKEPLRVFDKSPVTGEPVKLLDGRFGPYVTDGTTNASLPRDASPEALTFDQALILLADRAAAGGSKKKKKIAKASKKASSPKKAKTKTASSKKTPVKKSAKKTGKKKTAGE